MVSSYCLHARILVYFTMISPHCQHSWCPRILASHPATIKRSCQKHQYLRILQHFRGGELVLQGEGKYQDSFYFCKTFNLVLLLKELIQSLYSLFFVCGSLKNIKKKYLYVFQIWLYIQRLHGTRRLSRPHLHHPVLAVITFTVTAEVAAVAVS